jgi:hypothetical protein
MAAARKGRRLFFGVAGKKKRSPAKFDTMLTLPRVYFTVDVHTSKLNANVNKFASN